MAKRVSGRLAYFAAALVVLWVACGLGLREIDRLERAARLAEHIHSVRTLRDSMLPPEHEFVTP